MSPRNVQNFDCFDLFDRVLLLLVARWDGCSRVLLRLRGSVQRRVVTVVGTSARCLARRIIRALSFVVSGYVFGKPGSFLITVVIFFGDLCVRVVMITDRFRAVIGGFKCGIDC